VVEYLRVFDHIGFFRWRGRETVEVALVVTLLGCSGEKAGVATT
jgi:alpha-mannosidase